MQSVFGTRKVLRELQESRGAEARLDRRIDDLIVESRAQRQALLRMLDRLGPAPGTA
jgi:hypothetical protein